MLLMFVGGVLLVMSAMDGNIPVLVLAIAILLVGILWVSVSNEIYDARANIRRYWAKGKLPTWAARSERNPRTIPVRNTEETDLYDPALLTMLNDEGKFLSVKIEAEFIGKDGSCGLHTGQRYPIEIRQHEAGDFANYRVYVFSLGIPYDTMEAIKKNWKW